MADIQYITRDNQRWCDIAFICYGDAGKVGLLTDANPSLPIDTILPSGVSIAVPTIEVEILDTSILPPWKR